MKKFVKAIAAACIGVASTASSAAVVFEDFGINGNLINQNVQQKLGDKLNGLYNQQFVVAPDGSFEGYAFATFTALAQNEGSMNVGGTGLNTFFNIVGVLHAKGQAVGPNQFRSTFNEITFSIDKNLDTTATLMGNLAPTINGGSDDMVLGTAGPMSTGSGNLSGPPGAFNIDFKSLTLTPFGSQFFYFPTPFFDFIQVNGDIDKVTISGNGSVYTLTGDVSAVFTQTVPEPAGLALLGLGLLGAGAARRRKA